LVKNYARISAFNQWRLKVESKAPEIFQRAIQESAEEAISAVKLKPGESFRPVEAYGDGDDMGVFWTLDGLYDEKNDVGLWIEVWLPRKHVRWLNPESREDAPRVGLYAHAGANADERKQAEKWIHSARSAIRPILKGARKPSEDDDDDYFCAFDRLLFDEFVSHPDEIAKELIPILSEFTQHMLPALRAVEKPIQSFIRTSRKRRAR
jgi:hypothetical protein